MNNKFAIPAVSVGNLNLIRALGIANIPTYSVTSVANQITHYSRYITEKSIIPGPTLTPDQFVLALLEFAKGFKSSKPVLFYDGDADLLCISRNREALGKYYRLNMPPEIVVEALVDKSLFLKFAQENRLPIPHTNIFEASEAHDFFIEKDEYPVIVKPISRVDWFSTPLAQRLGNGGKAILARNRNELKEIYDIASEFNIGIIVQEMIAGEEKNIVSYHCYADNTGQILGEYCGKKHRTYPNKFGMSTCIEVLDLPEVKKIGREIVERLKLPGVAKLDFKVDQKTDKIILMEINPRFNIWNYPGAVYGVNLPKLGYLYLTDNLPESNLDCVTPPKRNVIWIDGERDIKSNKESGKGVACYVKFRLQNLDKIFVYNYWSWNDWLPFYMRKISILFEKLSRFSRKLGYSQKF